MQAVQTIYQHQSATFDTGILSRCRLSICLDPGLLTYVIVSPEGKIIAIKEYQSPGATPADLVAAALRDDTILAWEFAETTITSPSFHFTLLPATEFEPGTQHAWARPLLQQDSADHLVEYINIPEISAVAVYLVPIELSKACARFQNPKFQPPAAALIPMALMLAGKSPDLVILTLLGTAALITVVKDRKLQFCNQEEVAVSADLLYFAELATKVTGLGLNSFPVFFTGVSTSPLLNPEIFQKEIPALQFPIAELAGSFASEIENVPVWKYAFLSF